MSILNDLPDPDNPKPFPVEVPGRKYVKWVPKPKPVEVPIPAEVIEASVVDDSFASGSFDSGEEEETSMVEMPDENDPPPIGSGADLIREAFANDGRPPPPAPGPFMDDEGPIVISLPKQKLGSARTLGDWMSMIPQIAGSEDGPSQFHLGITRKKPQIGPNNEKIGGFQGHFSWMSDADFLERFGGGMYEITLYGPDPKGFHDHSGQVRKMPYADLKLDLPGRPVLPRGPDMTQNVPNGAAAVAETNGIAGIAQTLLKDRLTTPTATPDSASFLNLLNEQHNRTMEIVREQTAMERQRAEEAQRAARDSTMPNSALMDRLFQDKSTKEEVDRARRDYEDRLERVRADAETSRQRTENTYNERIRALEETSQRREDAIRSEFERRERDFRDQSSRVEKELRESIDRRERDMQTTFERRLEMERADRNREVDQMRRDAERDINAARTDNGRNVDSLRRDHERDVNTLKELQNIALHMKEAELDRLRSDNASMKAEVETLRAKVYMDPISQIEQAHKLAEMTGMSRPGDEKESGGVMDEVAKSLAANAPQILQAASPLLARFLPGGSTPLPPAQQLPPATQTQGPPAPPPGQPNRAQQRQPPPQQRPQQQQQRRVIGGPREDDDMPVVYAPPSVQGETVWVPSPPGTDAPPPAESMAQPEEPAQAAQPEAAPVEAQGAAGQAAPPQAQPVDEERLREVLARFTAATSKGTRPAIFTDQALNTFAHQATGAYRQGAAPADFVSSFVTFTAGAGLDATDWIPTGDSAADLLDLMTRGQAGWDMAKQRQWIVDAWAELGRLKKAQAKS